MLKNKIFAGVLAVMMMAPFSTGLLSFAAEENTLADYTFEELLAMEKEELFALVDEKENLLYNGEYLYDEAENFYEKDSHILLTIDQADLAEMGITTPLNPEEHEAVWDALQLPDEVADSLEYLWIVRGDEAVYDQFRIELTGETYQGYEAKEVAITLCMMLNVNPLVYYAMFEPITRDDETTAPAETTVPVETTTEAAAETTTETTTEATTATETAETTAFAETTTAAGTTTTGTASGGTNSPKTGDGSTAAVLAGCAAALAGCLLCRKRR